MLTPSYGRMSSDYHKSARSSCRDNATQNRNNETNFNSDRFIINFTYSFNLSNRTLKTKLGKIAISNQSKYFMLKIKITIY